MANINVAVKREKLIASVKQAIKTREDSIAKKKEVEEYNKKLHQEWLEKVKTKLGDPISINVNNSTYDPSIIVKYKIPATPEPKLKEIPDYNYQIKDELDALKNGLRLLELTDDEVIKTASYGSISRYL